VLLIDEHIRPDGVTARTYVDVDEGRLQVIGDDGVHGRLSATAVERVMKRYGRPLEEGIQADGEALVLVPGVTLRILRFRAQVDAAPRDWLVWHQEGHEPLAALATSISAALRFLVLRLAEESHKRRAATEGPEPHDPDDGDDDGVGGGDASA
jgi:hypothetical protein